MQGASPSEKRDWSRADIKAAIANHGFTLTKLAEINGFSPASISVCLSRPWTAVERIIADAIGEKPEVIWPHRYDADGLPIKRGGNKVSSGPNGGAVHKRTRIGSKAAPASKRRAA